VKVSRPSSIVVTCGRSSNIRGSVTVLAAAVLFLAGSLSLIAVDVMRALQAKGRAQTAADAAALAAAQEIALPSGITPQQAAADYAGRNGAALLSCTCEPGSPEAVVEVEVPVVLVFLGGGRAVRAKARAVIEGAQLGPMSTMAGDGSTGPGRAPPAPRGGGLHAGQAGAPSRVPPGLAVQARHL